MTPKFAVFIENRDIIAGVGNRIEIVAQQNSSLLKNQVEFLYYPYLNSEESINIEFEGDKGRFLAKPNKSGFMEINVVIGDTMYAQVFRIFPLTATVYLSNITSGGERKMRVNEIKAQLGLSAVVECCGFELMCPIIGFDVFKISSNNVDRIHNRGNRFLDDTKLILSQARPGDLYIFRNINYSCMENGGQIEHPSIIVEVE